MRYKGYYRFCPETENTNEFTEFLPFNGSHASEANTVLLNGGLQELPALRLINKWNRQAELFRYWIEN